jgi:UDP-N-acetylmuramoylalanine--D-glutamate ligase
MRNLAADYVVVGMGVTGRSCVRFLRARGATVTAMDSRERPPFVDELHAEFPDMTVVTGRFDDEILRSSGCIVMSPGVAPEEPAISGAVNSGVESVGDIQLFIESAKAPVIAITGTNGKSTVTTLVTEMLRAAGYAVRSGGNLGTPALELIQSDEPDCYVLELSSFQLELTRNLAPRIACILNLSPDHLDRHRSFDSYIQAKAKILDGAEIAVMNADDPIVAGFPFSGRRLDFTLGAPMPGEFGVRESSAGIFLVGPDKQYLAVDEMRLAGRHNVANSLAALAICTAFGMDNDAAIRALANFEGLEHRAEYVTNVGGVTYINDSKATNPGASCATINGLCGDRTGVLIAGGESKGADFTALSRVANKHLHTVVLIGAAAAQIGEVMGMGISILYATDMRAAVSAAANAARAGDIVLLSPACASFDMYENFEARGRAFRHAVKELEQT